MPFEKPSPGNPHQLTIKQHIFPQASIERFRTTSGAVSVQRKSESTLKALMPDNPMFCAKRVWDQRAEAGYMKQIEDKYQEIANQVVQDGLSSFSLEQQTIISDMYALWVTRFRINKDPFDDHRLQGVLGVRHTYSQPDSEYLEKMHVTVIKPDGILSGRNISGFHIQGKVMKFRDIYQGQSWGIIRSLAGEFIVPDTFGDFFILPVSPSIFLYMGRPSCSINEADVAKVNDVAIQQSDKFYFARDFSLCPRSSINDNSPQPD